LVSVDLPNIYTAQGASAQAGDSLGLSIFLDFLIWVVESYLIPHMNLLLVFSVLSSEAVSFPCFFIWLSAIFLISAAFDIEIEGFLPF
jgi:hypothetical protein